MKFQRGFALIGGLLILIIVGLLGGTGWYVWHHNKKTTPTVQMQTSSSVSSQNLIKVSELGIQFTVPDSLKDLIYKVADIDYNSPGNNDLGSYPTAYLSTTELSTLEPGHCSISSPSAAAGTVPPLGFMTKTTGQYPKDPTADNTTGPLVKQFSSYYISLRSPGMSCFSDEKNGIKAGLLFTQLGESLPKSIQEIN